MSSAAVVIGALWVKSYYRIIKWHTKDHDRKQFQKVADTDRTPVRFMLKLSCLDSCLNVNPFALDTFAPSLIACSWFGELQTQSDYIRYTTLSIVRLFIMALLHGPLMFAAKAKFYRVLYKQSSSIAFDETSSYWSAPKNS